MLFQKLVNIFTGKYRMQFRKLFKSKFHSTGCSSRFRYQFYPQKREMIFYTSQDLQKRTKIRDRSYRRISEIKNNNFK